MNLLVSRQTHRNEQKKSSVKNTVKKRRSDEENEREENREKLCDVLSDVCVCMRFKSDSIKIQLIVNVLKAQLFCRFKGKRNFLMMICV